MDHPAPDIRSFDAVKALAFIGDLSMGQPTDHSLRTAWLALQLAHAVGFDDDSRHAVAEASLLRWSGCTANASGFAQVLGDDVGDREAMLAAQPGWVAPLDAHGGIEVAVTPLVQIHCEVSGEVASMLKLAPGTELALRHIFETFDGHGLPGHLDHDAIPAPVPVIALAGDLEIFHRTYGLERALSVIAQRADARYAKALAEPLLQMAETWLSQLGRLSPAQLDDALLTPAMRETAAPELIADVCRRLLRTLRVGLGDPQPGLSCCADPRPGPGRGAERYLEHAWGAVFLILGKVASRAVLGVSCRQAVQCAGTCFGAGVIRIRAAGWLGLLSRPRESGHWVGGAGDRGIVGVGGVAFGASLAGGVFPCGGNGVVARRGGARAFRCRCCRGAGVVESSTRAALSGKRYTVVFA